MLLCGRQKLTAQLVFGAVLCGVGAERQIASSWLVVVEKWWQDSVAKQLVRPFSIESEGIQEEEIRSWQFSCSSLGLVNSNYSSLYFQKSPLTIWCSTGRGKFLLFLIKYNEIRRNRGLGYSYTTLWTQSYMAELFSLTPLPRYLMETLSFTGWMDKRKAFSSAVIQPMNPWWFSLWPGRYTDRSVRNFTGVSLLQYSGV